MQTWIFRVLVGGLGLMLVSCETTTQTTTGTQTTTATQTTRTSAATATPASTPKKQWTPQGPRQTGSHMP